MAESANTDNQHIADKKRRALKKVLVIAVAVIAVLVVISVSIIYPRYLKNSRNEAARLLLQQIALAETASLREHCSFGCAGSTDSACYEKCSTYVFTDGVIETAEAAIMRLADLGFRPDPSVAFHIMPLTTVYGEPLDRSFCFIALAAHNSVGSKVYFYDNIGWGGVQEVRRAVSPPVLSCYQYEFSNSGSPVVKKLGSIRIAPIHKDKSPARLVVVEAAE